MKRLVVSAFLGAIVFAALGAWLSDDLSTSAFEVALNTGSGNPFDYLTIILLDILVIPFVLVLELSPPASIVFFALNGSFWVFLCWAIWKILHRIVNRKRKHN